MRTGGQYRRCWWCLVVCVCMRRRIPAAGSVGVARRLHAPRDAHHPLPASSSTVAHFRRRRRPAGPGPDLRCHQTPALLHPTKRHKETTRPGEKLACPDSPATDIVIRAPARHSAGWHRKRLHHILVFSTRTMPDPLALAIPMSTSCHFSTVSMPS